MNNKKKVLIVFLLLIVVTCILLVLNYYNKENEQKKKNELEKKQELIRKENKKNEINSHFNNFVETNKDSKIYTLNDSKYSVVGLLSKKFKIALDEIEINYDTEYFKIKNSDCYIKYNDVNKSNEYIKNDRYKKYVVFNENVITKENVNLYRMDGSYFNINKSFNLPIYIKDGNKYYVEYDNELLYVNKSDVKEIKNKNNSNIKTRNNIRTLTYHTIYNVKTEKCTNSVICHPIEQFDSHMKYLSENNYLTLTMKELEMFLDKKIQIPKKSIVITLDDGKYAINAVNIVEKYKVNATYFIITKRHEIPKVETTYMEYQSHTHDLHNNWKCAGGNQGGQILCEKEEIILADLKKSREVIGGDVFALAYPFFDFNDRAINLLKKSGFRLAFIGQYDTDGYSSYNTDRFKLRRKTIFSNNNLSTFKSYLK